MSEVKFTPAPWVIRYDPFDATEARHSSIDIINEDGSLWLFTVMGSHVGPKIKEEIEANAKLIAGAPGMYDAIQCALNLKDLWSAQQHGTVSADHAGEMEALQNMQDMLEAALKKATT